MAGPHFVLEATAENFHTLVLENSERGLVLVSYWSPRAGPCLMLRPRLLKLAEEFGGRFLLVTLNTDELGQLAREQGVFSIPTVQAFRHGRVVDTLRGAEQEAVVRQFVLRQFGREPDGRRLAVQQAYQCGELERAAALAAQAAIEEPDDPRLPLDVARLLILQGRYAQAEELLRALPEPMRAPPAVQRLLAHARFLRHAREAPAPERLEAAIAADPNDCGARFQLAAVRVTQDDYENAMRELLEILRRDHSQLREDSRLGLEALFALLGEEDERVRHCRAQLAERTE